MSALTSLSIDQASFPVLDCSACGTRGLAYLHVGEAGEESLRCLRCDAEVRQPLAKADRRSLETMGYVFLDRNRTSPKAAKLSGCGAKGVKSCGSGGCSSGSCGTGGGCSSGGCGGG